MIPAAHVIFVLDNSGSMNISTNITKRSFDGMVEALQLCKGADIVMSLVKYGSRPVLEYARTHIQEVKPIRYQPNDACDVIYDSVLFAIDLASRAPRKEKTIIILQADGGDTSSVANPPRVFDAVIAAKRKGMEFLFLGANYLTAEQEEHYKEHSMSNTTGGKSFIHKCAKMLGFAPEEVILYNSNTAKESAAAFEETAANIGSVASGHSEHAAYTKEQQERVKGRN